jgi:Na+-translocating ferredoxin:NAD+ oxidoreductase RnfE subunit
LRIANKIGVGMVALFLVWFFYALFEELGIFVPLAVGVAILPILAWYFLLVYLYGKFLKLRIPLFIVFIPLLLSYFYYLERL